MNITKVRMYLVQIEDLLKAIHNEIGPPLAPAVGDKSVLDLSLDEFYRAHLNKSHICHYFLLEKAHYFLVAPVPGDLTLGQISIETLVTQCRIKELLKCRGFGPKSFAKISEKLREFGIQWQRQ